jgi:membrane-bound acyltransferase YfiQ involved in biofilm formation
MLLIAILNGALREFILKKYLSELAAHQLSTLTLVIFFAIYIRFIMHRFPADSSKEALFVGLLWMLMTLVFEFGFGLYQGKSWTRMLEDYNVLKGHVWVLIPLFVAIAPFLFNKTAHT